MGSFRKRIFEGHLEYSSQHGGWIIETKDGIVELLEELAPYNNQQVKLKIEVEKI